MNKITGFILITLLIISGCTTDKFIKTFTPDNYYYSSNQPTIDSIKKTHNNEQIYKKTSFFLKDFKENGELKSIYDYDFANEDAPCTVIGDDYKEKPIFKEEFYTVKLGNSVPFTFECRPTNNKSSSNQFRLFMMSTYHECNSRNFDYNISTIPYIRDYGKKCANGFKTKTNLKIEEEYKEVFKTHINLVSQSQKLALKILATGY